MYRCLFLTCLIISLSACGNDQYESVWVVDVYWTKVEPVAPSRVQAYHFDSENRLLGFRSQDIAWSQAEIGAIIYRDDLLYRVIVEDEMENLNLDIALYYDKKKNISAVREPNDRPASGSKSISIETIKALSDHLKKGHARKDILNLFRSKIVDEHVERRTDVIPLSDYSLPGNQLKAFFAGETMICSQRFEINTKDFRQDIYERVLVLELTGVSEEMRNVSRKSVGDELLTFIGEDPVLQSFDVYELRFVDNKTFRAGGLGTLKLPDPSLKFRAEEIGL